MRRGWTSMGEWFYKHKWFLKYRVSASRDQNYICHSVITEHTHHAWLCAHFEAMMNFFHPQLLHTPHSCTPLQVELYLTFSALTLLVSVRVHTECTVGAAAVCFGRSHWETLVQTESNQRGLESSRCVLLAHHTHMHTHTQKQICKRWFFFFLLCLQHPSLLCQKGSWEMWFCRNAMMKRLIIGIYSSLAWLSRSNTSDTCGHFSCRDVELCAGVGGKKYLLYTKIRIRCSRLWNPVI